MHASAPTARTLARKKLSSWPQAAPRCSRKKCRVRKPTAPSWPSCSAGSKAVSLKDTWADTTSPHGRLMLTVLGGLAEFERELIRARTGEGRKRAKANGVKFGRPTALTPDQRQEAMQKLAQGEVQADVARTFNVSQATISRLQV